jgi:hypothetical protein
MEYSLPLLLQQHLYTTITLHTHTLSLSLSLFVFVRRTHVLPLCSCCVDTTLSDDTGDEPSSVCKRVLFLFTTDGTLCDLASATSINRPTRIEDQPF